MNEQLINWILLNSKAGAADIPVLLVLAYKANIVGEATVKLAELAKLCRRSETEVRDTLRSAVKLKELEIFQNTDDQGNRLTNTYHFTAIKTHAVDGEDDISFDDPDLPGIPPPKVRDLPPKPSQPKIMMDGAQLEMLAADPIYKGLDVIAQAWKFRRWCRAQVPPAEETVRRFRVWLSKV